VKQKLMAFININKKNIEHQEILTDLLRKTPGKPANNICSISKNTHCINIFLRTYYISIDRRRDQRCYFAFL